MADESKRMSQDHQKWIVDTLKESGGSCSYERLVEVGEEHHCDTVGAMLKILKNRKVIHSHSPSCLSWPSLSHSQVIKFDQLFLMYPMHKDEIVTLLQEDYDPYSGPLCLHFHLSPLSALLSPSPLAPRPLLPLPPDVSTTA